MWACIEPGRTRLTECLARSVSALLVVLLALELPQSDSFSPRFMAVLALLRDNGQTSRFSLEHCIQSPCVSASQCKLIQQPVACPPRLRASESTTSSLLLTQRSPRIPSHPYPHSSMDIDCVSRSRWAGPALLWGVVYADPNSRRTAHSTGSNSWSVRGIVC